ncbi:hypothetical protein LGH70_11605 [Hymenobacter sp. BT635]|uniref:Uncharacterized protein n=1 Tax=Hymenobacter nitidus TaxID=2880929 RepID=A0ABS8AGW1_9BACT|nr:hypothetical protein [Hymenobacter nitidus]MCB2378234.1 hypothetical protein [Hymenobacter nitidus]
MADRRRYDDQLLTATYQKARLQNRSADSAAAAAFLAAVDSGQVDAQVAWLSGAIAAVQSRHDALPAKPGPWHPGLCRLLHKKAGRERSRPAFLRRRGSTAQKPAFI